MLIVMCAHDSGTDHLTFSICYYFNRILKLVFIVFQFFIYDLLIYIIPLEMINENIKKSEIIY